MKESGARKLWHCLESFKCLNTREASSVAKCSRSCVEKILGGFADVTSNTAPPKMNTTQERSLLGLKKVPEEEQKNCRNIKIKTVFFFTFNDSVKLKPVYFIVKRI